MEPSVALSSEGHTATVVLHGAHVTSWKAPSGQDLLFLSKQAVFAPPKAIRGGVPICFPQFGAMGPMSAQHGFARNVAWEVEAGAEDSVTLVLRYDGRSQPQYPRPFELRTRVSLRGRQLEQTLEVTNTGEGSMSFTCALHTYFRVASIDGVRVEGLQGARYMDNLKGGERSTDTNAHITFSAEFDRVYLGCPGPIKVVDPSGRRTFTVLRDNLPDAVVWNPWVDKARAMADFGDDEYTEMVCVESAAADPQSHVVLLPGQRWAATNTLAYEDSA